MYTPQVLADWVASELLDALRTHPVDVVVDPACGEGSLLGAVERQSTGDFRLVGYDIDPASVSVTTSAVPAARCFVLDALVDRWRGLGSGPTERPVGVIVNPPWGAAITHPPALLRNRGYHLANGQFDSYDLFTERLVRDLPLGSTVAAILPDSLFLPEHVRLRRLLLDSTTLLTVARLGEGLFPGVFRGTVVIVFRTGPPAKAGRVNCLRLRKAARRAVVEQRLDIRSALTQANRVTQSHLARTRNSLLDLHVTDSDREILARFEDDVLTWDAWFEFSRGTEIGKGGRVVACPQCGHARPEPRAGTYLCRRCGQPQSTHRSARDRIILPQAEVPDHERWKPVVVGEDVDRYRIRSGRTLKVGVPGIDYKRPHIYGREKILVRKTGVGIKAMLDRSGLYTTQVVYHIARRPGSPDFTLAYLLGVLSSRCLLAYHLSVSGELEWRSHPYLTPKVIRTLPIPDPGAEGSPRWRTAEEIAGIVDGIVTRGYTRAADMRIEALVATLVGLHRGHLPWVAGVLDAADDLEAIRSLRFDPAAVDLLAGA